MDWAELERNFVVASEPDGDRDPNVLEWDHARYSRALGVTDEPGLHELRSTGCTVLGLPAAKWPLARQRYSAWAAETGWSLVRVSARPSTLVPDATVHGLGVALAGPDGMLFARSGQQGCPATRRGRPRPAGLSFAIDQADRWLIAANRVRRRVRNEVAQRGLVLFVEEAEKLSASALTVLGYLVDAHRAWRARMLARDARVHVVLATQPEFLADVRAMLERFGHGDAEFARSEPRPGVAPTPAETPVLDVEEEHVVEALAAAPLALSTAELRRVFGDSVGAKLPSLVERGVLEARVEGGERVFAPHARDRDEAHESRRGPPARVLSAFEEVYRRRLKRRGHAHARAGLAVLAFRRGAALRGLAHFGALEPGYTATIGQDVYRELDAHLAEEPLRHHLRAGDLALWLAMRAHQRDYKGAQQLAADLARTTIRGERDLSRMLCTLLAIGRSHTDQVLPQGFWADLRSEGIDGATFDGLCVLAELTCSARNMTAADVVQRFQVASGLAAQPRLDTLALIAKLALAKFESVVGTCMASRPSSPILRFSCIGRGARLPAYFLGSVAYGFLYAGDLSRVDSTRQWNLAIATGLTSASGVPADAQFCVDAHITVLFVKGASLLVRDLLDEKILSLPSGASPALRFRLLRAIQKTRSARATLWGMREMSRRGLHHMRQQIVDGHHEVPGLAAVLLCEGDFRGALDVLRVGLEATRDPVAIGTILLQHVAAAFRGLMWDQIDVSQSIFRGLAPSLPPAIRECVGGVLGAVRLLIDGDTNEALSSLAQTERRFLGRSGSLASASALVRDLRVDARRLSQWSAALSNRPGHTHARAFRRLMWDPHSRGRAPTLARFLGRLGFCVLALEKWASSPDTLSGDDVVELALVLRQQADSSLCGVATSLCQELAKGARTFAQRLETELMGRGVLLGEGVSSVDSALSLLNQFWGDRRRGPWRVESIGKYSRTILVGGSARRSVSRDHYRWLEDASTYWACMEQGREASEFLLSCREPKRPHGFHLSVRGRVRGGRIQATFRVARGSAAIGEPRAEHAAAKRTPDEAGAYLGDSLQARRVREFIEMAARCDYPVLLLGETGTGKGLVAKCIHAASARGGKPIVVTDCAATMDSLLEAELFGHVQGAYTGADRDRQGRFALAHESTLLLDEADSMSGRMQGVLLRVLEGGKYRPIGSASTEWSDFRLITTALPGLDRARAEQGFRDDLYYRISTLRIVLPPLRERGADALTLAHARIRAHGLVFSQEACDAIASYSWPGNVRQLQHVVDVAALSAVGGVVGLSSVTANLVDADLAVVSAGPRRPAEEAAEVALAHLSGLDAPFTANDLAAAAGTSRRSAQRHLALLLNVGRVVRIGAGKATRYHLSAD
ncbi:MAG: sigma-54-dependent transcriptional regulator [Planctomycetota bacterium]|jgi:DNA-binding NtrC family response regulator